MTPAISGTPSESVKTRRSTQPRRSKIRMWRNLWNRASIVASTAIAASLTSSVSRNCSGVRTRGSTGALYRGSQGSALGSRLSALGSRLSAAGFRLLEVWASGPSPEPRAQSREPDMIET